MRWIPLPACCRQGCPQALCVVGGAGVRASCSSSWTISCALRPLPWVSLHLPLAQLPSHARQPTLLKLQRLPPPLAVCSREPAPLQPSLLPSLQRQQLMLRHQRPLRLRPLLHRLRLRLPPLQLRRQHNQPRLHSPHLRPQRQQQARQVWTTGLIGSGMPWVRLWVVQRAPLEHQLPPRPLPHPHALQRAPQLLLLRHPPHQQTSHR
mmetsp:Transcript_3331/g.8285  ORF Transcript_3331/g.8285 Transcript_3331/m.8285 type:complete len:207 (+) Transcript_3331:2581-3201(+)